MKYLIALLLGLMLLGCSDQEEQAASNKNIQPPAAQQTIEPNKVEKASNIALSIEETLLKDLGVKENVTNKQFEERMSR